MSSNDGEDDGKGASGTTTTTTGQTGGRWKADDFAGDVDEEYDDDFVGGRRGGIAHETCQRREAASAQQTTISH